MVLFLFSSVIHQGRTINDLGGGALAKAEKKLNGYLPGKENLTQQAGRKKKAQLNNLEEKKTQLNNLEEKKIHPGLYARLRCPEHGHKCLFHTI